MATQPKKAKAYVQYNGNNKPWKHQNLPTYSKLTQFISDKWGSLTTYSICYGEESNRKEITNDDELNQAFDDIMSSGIATLKIFVVDKV